MFTAIIAVCAFISIPSSVPFTLQTFAIFLAVLVLGGKMGSLSVFIYLCLGAIGVPIFAGFNGGIGVLLGNTGGYILGFMFIALIMWMFETVLPKRNFFIILSMIVGLFVCYAFGSIWFVIVYTKNTGAIGIGATLMMCVIPYIIPDFIKMFVAFALSRRIKKILHRV